ncbi:MAG: T9SS type A sorting domain-containing protein [Bacteroidales bacterium]
MKKFLLLFVLPAITLPLAAQQSMAPDAMRHQRRHIIIKDPVSPHRKPLRPEMRLSPTHLKAAGQLNVLDSLVESIFVPASSSWAPDFKAFYTFDDNGLITEYREEGWNNDSRRFEQTDYETYEYDEQGNLVVYIDYDQYGTNFYSRYKIEYTYDNGMLMETLESGKDTPEDSWYTIWRTDYSYNDNNQISGTREYINNNGWKESWRTEYVYDGEGRLITYYDYNDNADLPSGWEYAWREEYTYDFEGHLDIYEESEWDPDFNQWFPTDREEYNIFSNGDVQSYTDFDWDDAGEEWIPNAMGEYTYNPDIPYEELALPWFFHDDVPNYFNHMMTRYIFTDYAGGDWVPSYMGDYYFTLSSSTGLTTSKQEGLLLYPNPASTTLYIPAGAYPDIRRVEAYDPTGKRVLSIRVPQQQSIRVDQLDQGIYFFRLLDASDQVIITEKIFLQH